MSLVIKLTRVHGDPQDPQVPSTYSDVRLTIRNCLAALQAFERNDQSKAMMFAGYARAARDPYKNYFGRTMQEGDLYERIPQSG